MGCRLRLAVTAIALAAVGARAAPPTRVGVLTVGADDDCAEARAALVAALPLADFAGIAVERTATGEAEAAAALVELRQEGVETIVAIGESASRIAHASVRDRPVVCLTFDDGRSAALREGGATCVVAGLQAAAAAAELRRPEIGLRRTAVIVPRGDESARANALGFGEDAVVVEVDGAGPQERAGAAAARLDGVDAVWLPPSIPAADAEALARALRGRRVPLVGSRKAHLDAGCAFVVRSDPRDLGALAAVLAREVLAGGDPAKIAVRRPRRRLLEAGVTAAGRLDYVLPTTLLARADLVAVARPRTAPR
jgi:ABC-type uncharacterized transport system substrate-binding protein